MFQERGDYVPEGPGVREDRGQVAAEGVSEETVDDGLAPNQLLTLSPCASTMEYEHEQ